MVVLFLMVYFSLYIISYGQDVGFTYNTDCYSAGDTMTLTAVYTGSGTVTAVQWYYNGQVAQNLLIVAATCNPFTPIDSGYPASRMTYECNTGTNTFKLVLTGLLEAELNKTWGATFSLSAGSSPSVNQTEITTCQPTSATNTTTTPSSSSTSTTSSSTSTTTTSMTTTTTSTSSTSVSESMTTRQTSATSSATTTNATLATTSITKAIPEATTASSDSSSSETVVIIVVSVVGGLFAVGIVITIVLMLLKRKKPDSKAIHNYQASRNTGEFQRPKSLGSVGHSKHSGSHFKQKPLYVRHSNQSVAYQYQPWNGRHNSRSLRYIYPGLASGEQYSGVHVGRDRRVNETPDYYNPGNHRRQQYYIHSSDTHRSKSRPPTLETLQIDDQNYVAANYSMYW